MESSQHVANVLYLGLLVMGIRPTGHSFSRALLTKIEMVESIMKLKSRYKLNAAIVPHAQ